MHILGVQGMPRRNYTYAADLGWNFWNFIVSMGAFLTAFGAIIFAINVFWSLKKGEKAPNDPWDARTLEWTIPSPPPEYNFGNEPTVKQLDDFWFRKYDHDGNKLTPAAEKPYNPDDIHMPGPSFWPIVLAFGITLGAAGFFVKGAGLYISLAGVATILVAAYGWIYEEA